MNFKRAKIELKKLAKGDYHSIRYEVSEHRGQPATQECCLYIHDHDSVTAATWVDALAQMKQKISPQSIKIASIEELK